MQCRQVNECLSSFFFPLQSTLGVLLTRFLLDDVAEPAPPLRAHLAPHVQGLAECLVGILLNTTTPKSLLENAAVTIGRLGLIYPEIVAVHLASFGKQWSVHMPFHGCLCPKKLM